MKWDRGLAWLRDICRVLVLANLTPAIVMLRRHEWVEAATALVWTFSPAGLAGHTEHSAGNANPRTRERGDLFAVWFKPVLKRKNRLRREMKKTIILLTVCLAPLGAQIHALKPEVRAQSPLAVQQQGLEFVLPELIVGGEWTTTLRLRNMGTAPIPNTNLYFIDNNGNPMTLNFISSSGQPTTSQGATFFLDPQASFEVTFTGGSTTQWGQAIIDLCHSTPCINGLYGEVVLRNRNATRPDFESLFPIEEPAPLQYMLFDHRNGFQTVLYLNNDSTSTLNVTLNFVDNGNRMVASVPLTMPSASSQLLNLGVIAPATNGIEGTLQIVANVAGGTGAPLLTATAIRINPSNSFTPIRSFIPK